MDFHSLRRRELQTLCKKQGIPANSTNVEMANSLSDLLKVSICVIFMHFHLGLIEYGLITNKLTNKYIVKLSAFILEF